MNLDLVEILLKNGFALPCSACEHMHKKFADGVSACGVADCAGPYRNQTYPKYKGVITESAFADFCFHCGARSDHGIKIGSEERVIGVCAQHLSSFAKYETREEMAAAPRTIITPHGERTTLVQILPKPKKNLFAAIAEYDAELDAEEARKKK
jgi:hypothetical protein